MNSQFSRFASMVIIVAALLLAGLSLAAAEEEKDMQGWGIDSAYNRYYDVSEFEKFKGLVVGFKEEPPMEGMSPATIVIVRDGSELIDVQLCPTWFAGPADVGVKKGDQVTVKGAWAEIDGKDVFMASKIKKGETFEFKVRLTKDGTPFWTMTPEQLAQERASSND
jgi:hypothetical protein